ncbi:hypothetical protein A0O34_11725 [Chryseobacterium glaciei]|uniref:Glycine dehydrogenase n=1 Tax=Chryseobacterium glaciei TaxID=1685010 RepID=A0A172XWB6_9FLAO|nr:hypothetical protein [Chryseobacterium glaciei]ANF51142.1 hypothetical protein A0O34_11725 [Chryseobacterium glaciei]
MKFFNRLLNNCEETSLNIIKSEETSLSFSAWLKMKFHILFCKCCQNFKKQTKVIDEALYKHFESEMNEDGEHLSQELKDKIKESLKK